MLIAALTASSTAQLVPHTDRVPTAATRGWAVRPVEHVLPEGPVVQTPDGFGQLVRMVAAGHVCVLTGAGISTESGIPDYRGPDGRRRVTPMTYAEFVSGTDARRRYWARSFVGWRRFAVAGPNQGHRAVAALQRVGVVSALITQNVDGLHQAAGSVDPLELHGTLDGVVCLRCGDRSGRLDLDHRLREANPSFEVAAGPLRPDGDVELDQAAVDSFHLVACVVCGSDLLKPDVTFFGESVPIGLVARCSAAVEESSALLVLGSSLQVMSGYRFVRRAARLGIPVAILTHGTTRGEAEASLRLDAPLGQTLSTLVGRLSGATDGAGSPGGVTSHG